MKFAALLKTALSGTHRGTVGQGERETDYINRPGLSHLQYFGKNLYDNENEFKDQNRILLSTEALRLALRQQKT